jgi:hypothetical protein
MTVQAVDLTSRNNSINSSIEIDNVPSVIRPKTSFLQKVWSLIPSRTDKSHSPTSNADSPSLLKRIWNTVKSILNLGLGLFLYWTNNSLFAISLFVGISRPDQVSDSINKIKNVWETQPFNTLLIGSLGSVLGGVGSVLSLPVTVAAGSILYAANLGANLSIKAQEIVKKREQDSLGETLQKPVEVANS